MRPRPCLLAPWHQFTPRDEWDAICGVHRKKLWPPDGVPSRPSPRRSTMDPAQTSHAKVPAQPASLGDYQAIQPGLSVQTGVEAGCSAYHSTSASGGVRGKGAPERSA